MGKQVDDRVVRMKFDNAEFEQKVSKTMGTLDKLKAALNFKGAEKGLDEISNKADRINFGPMTSAIETVGTKFSALEVMGVTALANIANSAVNTGKRMVESLTVEPIGEGFKEYELKMGSVQTIMASTGASLEEVNGYLAELNTYSDKTIYSFADMTNNIGKFTNAGVKLEDAVAAIQGVSNEAAVSGANAQEASRAMYNFAQALSAGYVKLIDWKSIENANMATVEFKNELLNTAKEIGTVAETADGMYQVLSTNNKGSTMEDAISATRNFNDSLSYQWMTTEVLTKTLAKYADETTEIGKKAFAAAQDIKTFHMLMDTLKEAVGSGWAQTFEIIIGDFEEAKELWTDIGKVLGGIIDSASDARNRLLGMTLQRSSWGDLKSNIKDAGIGVKEFKEGLLSLKGTNWDAVKKEYGSMDEAFKKGLFNASDIDKTTESLIKSYNVQKQSAKLTEEEKEALNDKISKMRQLQAAANRANTPLHDTLETIGREKSGRELLIEAASNAFHGLMTVINSVKDAWNETFDGISHNDLYGVILAINKFSESLKVTNQQAENIKKTFKGLFAIIDIVSMFTGSVAVNALKILMSALGYADLSVLDMTADLGDLIVQFRDWLKEHNYIAKAAEKTGSVIRALASAIRDVVKDLLGTNKEFTTFNGNVEVTGSKVETLGGLLGSLLQILSNFVDKLSIARSFEEVKNAFDGLIGSMKDFLSIDVLSAFDKIQNGTSEDSKTIDWIKLLSKAFEVLQTNMEKFARYIKGEFSGIGFGEIFAAIYGIVTWSVVKKTIDVLDKFATAVSKPFEVIDKIGKGVVGVLEQTQNVLSAMSFKIKAEALSKVATSLALLAGSIYLLAQLPAPDLWNAVGAIVALAAALSLFTGILMAVSAKMNVADVGKTNGVASVILAFAGSMVLLGIALKKIYDVVKDNNGSDNLLDALTILGSMVGVMTAVLVVLSAMPAAKIEASATSILALSGGIYILCLAVKQIADVVEDKNFDLTRLIAVIGSLSIALMSLMAVSSVTKFGASTGLGIAAMSAALFVAVKSLKKISSMSDRDIKRGLAVITGIFSIFAVIMGFARLSGEHTDKVGKGIATMASSIVILAVGMKVLATIKDSDVKRGLKIIAQIFAIFTGIMAFSKLSGEYAAKAGFMILEMSAAIAVLSTSIIMLSYIKEADLKKSVNAISQLMIVFGILVGLSKFAADTKGAKTTIMALVGCVSVLSVALVALSLIKDKDAVMRAALAIESLVGVFAALVYITKYANITKNAVASLAVLTGVVGILAIIIGALSNLGDPSGVIASAESLSVLLLAMSGALVILQFISKTAIEGVGVLALLLTAVAGIAAILGVLAALDVQPSLESAEAISALLLSMTAALIPLSIVGALAAEAIVGIGVLDVFIVDLGLILAALGELSPDLQNAIQNGIPLLVAMSEGMGTAIGSFASGFGVGLSSGMPAIAKNLSDFMVELKPFLSALNDVKSDSISAAKNMAEVLVIMGGAKTLDAVGNMINKLTGSKEIDISKTMEQLAKGIKAYLKEIGEISGEDISKVSASMPILSSMIDVIKKIPNEGGLMGALAGENNADEFGDRLKTFAIGIKDFSNAAEGIMWEYVKRASENLPDFLDVVKQIPNEGGLMGALAGENNADEFGGRLKAFGTGIREFSNVAEGIMWSHVKKASENLPDFIKVIDEIPNEGGWLGAIVGENNADEFAGRLEAFGKGIREFSNVAEGIMWKPIITASGNLPSLIETLKEMANMYGTEQELVAIGGGLRELGNGIKDYANAINEADLAGKGSEAVNLGETLTSNLMAGMQSGVDENLKNLFHDWADEELNRAKELEPKATEVGESLVNALSNGVKTQDSSTLSNQFTYLINIAIGTIRGRWESFKEAGEFVVEGFIKGLNSKSDEVKTAGANLANKADEGLRNKAVIKSPSKLFYQNGAYCGQGFINAFHDYGSKAAEAGAGIASESLNGLNSIMNKAGDYINANMDFDPTIRPVLDLSGVKSGVNSLSGLFDMTPEIGAVSNISAIQASMNNRNQNGINDDVVSAIDKLGKKISGMSGDTYQINGITYDDGSNIASAIGEIARVARIEGRV